MKNDDDDKLRIQTEQDLRRIITELQLIPPDLLPDFTLKIEYFQKQEGLEHNWGYSRKKKASMGRVMGTGPKHCLSLSHCPLVSRISKKKRPFVS